MITLHCLKNSKYTQIVTSFAFGFYVDRNIDKTDKIAEVESMLVLIQC